MPGGSRGRRFDRTGVYRTGDGWVAVHKSEGGGVTKQLPRATEEEAEADLRADIEFERKHWEGAIERARRDPAVVVIDGHYYRIGPAGGSGPVGSRNRFGFGGREFRIRKHDGTEVVTHNLWSAGIVPTEFRSHLPNNARFVDERH